MKDARLVVAGDGNAEFVWTQVDEGKWVERFYKKFEDEWSLIHKVEYLSQAMVEEFVTRLQAVGFMITFG